MNYRAVYMHIISHAKSEENSGVRKKGNGKYYERHHILPKSLFPKWRYRGSNLVLLTAKEHYICHMCATKIWYTKEMICAFMFMCKSNKNSTMYKISREYYAKYFSGEGNPMWGRSAIREMSEERKAGYKKHMSEILKKVPKTENWRKNISTSLKGKKKNPNHKKKMVETLNRARPNAIQKAIEAHKGKHWFNDGLHNVLAFIAPEGFVPGKLQKESNPQIKAKMYLIHSKFGKGKHWFNNGEKNFFGFNCPEGYIAGRLYKV